MALLQEIWVQDIQEQLFESNEFLLHSTDHSPYAKGAVVYVPAAGSAPNTERGRTALPAAATARADSALSYAIASRSTDPVIVPDLESFQLSYDKRQSVMQQHLDKLMEDTGRDIALEWSATLAPRIVRTSGAASGGSLSVGATGQRKKVEIADIAKLAQMFDIDNLPQRDRYLMLHPALYYELFSTDALIRADVMGRTTLPTGAITQLFGFNILVKPSVPIYSNAGTPAPKAVGSTSAVTDNLAGLAWHKNSVARAISGIEVYENAKDATYYGDVLSAKLFCGGMKLRAGEVGVAALVQTLV